MMRGRAVRRDPFDVLRSTPFRGEHGRGRNKRPGERTAVHRRPQPKGVREMNTYAIRREKAWQSPKELEATAERSKEVAGTEFPDDIAWIRSYVIKEEGGTLGTICIYQASSVDKVREHAKRVDMPADEVLEIADTVIVRPDPQPQAA